MLRELKRSATYIAPVDCVFFFFAQGLLTPEDAEKASKDSKNPLAQTGLVNALANNTHGGVIAEGGIRRDAVLALSALKLLRDEAQDAQEAPTKLQRYILGLALVAFTKLPLGYYRQGTILVLDPEKKREFQSVPPKPMAPALMLPSPTKKPSLSPKPQLKTSESGKEKPSSLIPKLRRPRLIRPRRAKRKVENRP